MKTLCLTAMHFRLPDDFAGNEADALRLLADYLDEKNHPAGAESIDPDKTVDAMTFKEGHAHLWGAYYKAVGEGKRLCGSFGIHETVET